MEEEEEEFGKKRWGVRRRNCISDWSEHGDGTDEIAEQKCVF